MVVVPVAVVVVGSAVVAGVVCPGVVEVAGPGDFVLLTTVDNETQRGYNNNNNDNGVHFITYQKQNYLHSRQTQKTMEMIVCRCKSFLCIT